MKHSKITVIAILTFVTIMLIMTSCEQNSGRNMSYDEYFSTERELTAKNLTESDLQSIKSTLKIEEIANEEIAAYENLIFYRDGDNIYRYYQPTKTLDLMINSLGELSINETSNNESTNSETLNNKSTNNGELSNSESTINDKSSNESTKSETSNNNSTNNGELSNNQSTINDKSSNESTNNETTNDESTNNETSNNESTNNETSSDKSTNNESTNNGELSNSESSNNQSSKNETSNKLINAEHLLNWTPLTNNKISLTVRSEEYLEAVEENNGSDGYTDSDFREWFINKYENHPSVFGYFEDITFGLIFGEEITKNYTIAELLQFCNISVDKKYIYDFVSKKVNLIEKQPLSYEEYFSIERAFNHTATSSEDKMFLAEELTEQFDMQILWYEIQACENLIFFRVDNNIYRYYVPTETLELLFASDEMFRWKAFSNNTLLWEKDNPVYWECIEQNGGSEQLIENPEEFYDWYIARFENSVDSESLKIRLKEDALMPILSDSGIYKYLIYYYDTTTGLSTETYPLRKVKNADLTKN